MSMPLSPTRLFVCTACGAMLPIGEEHLGKKCRCGRCGRVNLISEDSPGTPAATRSGMRVGTPAGTPAGRPGGKPSGAAMASAEPIRFGCRVCDTRMAARVNDAGRKAKCPDCGALTIVPPPPQPTPQQVPRAMHGQQYGLWSVEGAPDPQELATSQPKFFPVYCRVCDTLMHALPKQIGKQLACPDCGAKTVIKAPPPPQPKKSPLVPDGQEYQLDVTQAPLERPPLQFKPAKSITSPAAAASTVATFHQRPKMPPVPILQGVGTMLWRSPVLTWFAWLSALGLTVGGFLLVVVSINPVAAIPFFIAAGCSALMGFCAAAAICLAVLTESSEGNDRLHNPPGPVFLDWMGDVFYLITAGMLAFAPWWLLCRVLEQEVPIEVQGLLMATGWLFTFPLLLLSCLENGSPMELFSARVFGSVSKRPGQWLLLVVESVLIAGGTGFAVTQFVSHSTAMALLAIPLCVAAALLYFRVLGRFAWWLAESLSVAEE